MSIASATTSPESHPDRFPTREHELAYWINAYNAFTLRGVIDAYPIASVKDAFVSQRLFQPPDLCRWGREMTLDHIENKIIRPTYQEPRIHFAVNCAALSCPQLDNRAFTAPDLDARLEQGLTRFAQDPNHVRLQGKQLYLSKILDWYGEDFTAWFPPDRPNPENMPTIVNYLRPYLLPDLAAGLTEDIAIEYNELRLDAQRGQRNGKPPPSGRLPVIDPTPFWSLIRKTDCAPVLPPQ